MDDVELNDFITGVSQDFCDIQSMIKILKDAVCNQNLESTMIDIENTLEIIIAKMVNTKYSLDKYIDTVFEKK